MTAIATPPARTDDVRRVVLPNGLTVLVRRDASAPVVAIVTYVKAGYFDETDDVVGIAHVLEHMFFKGTPRRGVGEIAKQTKASGGFLNAHTIYDHTSYYTVLPASALAAGLDIQSDAYAHSVIDAQELAKELEVIIQEAKRKADNPGAVTTETLYELLHDRHRMRRWRIGREAGLRTLDQAALLRFYRNFYRPGNTVLVVVGDVDVDRTLVEIEARYGAIPAGEVVRTPGEAEPARHEVRFRELAGDVAQTQLAFGWRTVPTLDPDAPRLDLAAAVLATGRSSRLYRAVRERQLATSVSAYNYTPAELGVFVVHAEGPPEKAPDAARALWAEVQQLRRHGVTAAELDRAQRIFEARWLRRLESMDGQANHLAEWEALGDYRLGERYLDALLAATPDEVNAAVRRHLDPAAVAVVAYRPNAAAPLAADASGLRTLLDSGLQVATPPDEEPPAPSAEAEGRATFEREIAGVRVYRTPSGVPVLVRRRSGAPIVHLGVYAKGGARLEAETVAGLTSLMTRTSLKGTARRSARQIAEAAEVLGGSVGASATAESLGWSLSVPAKHLATAVELLADVVQGASFPAEALETERAIAIADVAAARDDMYRWPLRLATGAAYGGHPYGVPASGTEASLSAIGIDDVRRWHASQVLEGETVVGVVGDVEPDEVAALLAGHFSRLTARATATLAAPAWPADVIERAERREKAQSALLLAFPGPARRDPRRVAARLLGGIASGLGGRFFDELRDRQSLAYTVHAFSAERELAGMFVAYIATSPEKEDVARAGLLAEFEKFRTAPVTEEELQRAQTYAIGTHAIDQQSGGSLLGHMVEAWMFAPDGLGELATYDDAIRAVTREELQALAAEYFDPARRVEGVIRGVGKSV